MTTLKSFTVGCVLALTCGVLHAQEGIIDATFNPADLGFGFGDGASGPVYSSAVQADGKLLIAGYFGYYNGTVRGKIARIYDTGIVDLSFDPGQGANNSISCMAIQPDGKILIGGSFTAFNGFGRNRIARLNANGSLDTGFNPGTGADQSVLSLALQADGKVLIAGAFTQVNGSNRKGVARLNMDGSLDAAFSPGTGANSSVFSMVVQPDSKVIIGGDFTSYNGTVREHVARLNTNGTLDAGFDPGLGADTTISCVTLRSDGKVLVGGSFTSIGGTARNRIARLNASGSLDTSFDPGTGANGPIISITVGSDGKIWIGGDFTTFNGVTLNRIARLVPEGGLDANFNPGEGANNKVFFIVILPDGRALIGGYFFSYDLTARSEVALLNADGSLNTVFYPGTSANNHVMALALRPSGQIVMGGFFTSYDGTTRNRVAQVNADGSLDAGFDPGLGANDILYDLTLQPNGKVVIVGDMTTVNGTARKGVARLNTDGSLDTGFDPGTGAHSVRCVKTQPDGKILIGGLFPSYNGALRKWVARINTDGSLDPGFITGTGPNNSVFALAVQTDGKVLIGGGFTTFNGSSRVSITRVNADGSLDTSFDPGTGANGGYVYSIAVQPDGKILIGGSFTSYNGTPRGRIARLNPDGSLDIGFDPGTTTDNWINSLTLLPDRKILVGGNFTSFNGLGHPYIVRLNPDGSVDGGFNQGTGPTWGIRTAALQPDGKILIGGLFQGYNGTGRNRIARITGTSRTGIKLMLEGPYSGTTMTDALRTLPSFPLTEPFTAIGYAETGYVSGATIGASVLSVTGNNAIVDWVIVEMRPVATPGTVAASRAVLLQRDGDVVDLDGVSTVGFAGLAAGNYCVAVKPRNHLPVMLSATTPVSYGSAIATVDFTLPTTQVYDNDARKNVSGVMVLAAGDVSFNEVVGYTGAGNDRDPILTRVGSTTPNNSVSGYWREDVNMDGVVKYTGSANDRDPILVNVGSTTPNNTRVATLP